MKILLPVSNSNDPENNSIEDLESAKYACIYNIEEDSYELTSFQNISPKKGNLSVALKRQGIHTIICEAIPSLALELFNIMGIKIYQNKGLSVKQNIGYLLENKLQQFGENNGISSTECSTSTCSSCNSSCG